MKALHQGFRDGCAMPNWHQALPSLHHLPSWLHHRSARWDPTLSCKYQVPQVAESATCGIHNISISHKSLAQEQRAQRKEVRQVNLFEKTRAPPAKKIQLLGFELHGLSSWVADRKPSLLGCAPQRGPGLAASPTLKLPVFEHPHTLSHSLLCPTSALCKCKRQRQQP